MCDESESRGLASGESLSPDLFYEWHVQHVQLLAVHLCTCILHRPVRHTHFTEETQLSAEPVLQAFSQNGLARIFENFIIRISIYISGIICGDNSCTRGVLQLFVLAYQ